MSPHSTEEHDEWMRAPWHEAGDLQKPLPDDQLVDIMRGAEKEDNAASSTVLKCALANQKY
ncbi:hypothetical protein [Bradyrhizobium ottawaense]|uniref:Uncharacterized protein n=1 Tax=Bradyrhizobium ottawaense TaxID=931866 RepID=A0A2U8PGE4_9BRAD|nr:hypothetical protein [Bradyrhizobium ottawaense]AWL96809.1 hypothetical protein CIT37_35285 [Bradyrhizobium ottawaense]MBR1326063.1 hypothetical protein [Bradyrhizobium ottawaense]